MIRMSARWAPANLSGRAWLCAGYAAFAWLILALTGCAAAKVTQPPSFDYPVLLDSFFHSNPGGHFPVILQKGMNTDPAVSGNGYLFYASDSGGSSDIWMRQLRSTVNLVIVEQAAAQTSPAVSGDGRLLAYVSYDRDPAGDILLTAVDPDAIAQDVLRGKAVPNHFASSISVSSYIEKAGRADCAGEAAELDPFLSPDGRMLYFASDRCHRGTFTIWSVSLGEDGRPSGTPAALFDAPGIQPVVGARFLVATALGSSGRPDGFLLFPLSGGKVEHIRLDALRSGLAMRPVLSADERQIFFLYAPRDTNGDGKIDRNDNGGVYSFSTENHELRHVIDDAMPVYSIAMSAYLQGGILYAAYEGGRSRIFLSRPEGVILKKENTLEQYLYALGLSDRGRRPIALESVVQFHSSRPEFFLFEADLYAELQRAFTEDRGGFYRDQLKRTLAENPFASLSREAGDGKDPARIERVLASDRLQSLSPERRRIAVSWLRDQLATSLEGRGRRAEALSVLESLNQEDPGYFNGRRTILRELALHVSLRRSIPDRIRQLLSQPQTENRLRQQVLQVIFEEVRRGSRLDPRSEPQPILRGLLFVLEGQHAFQERRYDQARELVQEGLKSTGEQNLAYTYGWKLLTSIYELQQEPAKALEARLRFLTSYQRDWNLDVEEADFQRLIDSSKGLIEAYRASAASIAEDVEDRQDFRLYLIGQIQTATNSERLALRLPDRNLLAQFCDASSAAGLLIRNLGYKDYQERQAKICTRVDPYLKGAVPDLSLEDASEASQLFYVVSYANANLINILFLQFRAAGLFDELHRTWSVYYHRIKVDIAIERLKRNITWQEKQSELLKTGAVVSLFTDRDPFDAKIFEEIMVGYRMGEDNARRDFDQSLLYGYAYLLIRKSEEREAFYDALPGRGVSLSSSELIRRKESVLADLKQAEYRLQYIRSVDPGFVDATLLLSWLYQYIDARRSMPIAQETGNTERIVRGIFGMRTSRPEDGLFFRASYQKFFGSRYYERNVDLLNDAVDEERSRPHPGLEKSLALLQLNLGNNYFQLINYRAAAEAYDLAEGLSKKSSDPIFDTWVPRVLFHVNRGRARFYAGQAGEAATDFAEGARLLSENDYWPMARDSNRAYYAYKSESASKYLRARSDRRQQEFLKARYRLAFARTLQGLALRESGNPAGAVVAYREAVRLLYGRETVPEGAVSEAGLENYVAMAFQDMEDYERSDLAASSAAESARQAGLSQVEERFHAQTVGGRLLGVMLGYGEDFSVIGEGRTPFGFSPVRQLELSLGIRVRNQARIGDLDAAVNLLSERIALFKSRDSKHRLGREGIIYALNQKAEIAFTRGDYSDAFELYRESAKIARKAGMLPSYRLNFRNSYYVLFRQAETGSYKSAAKMDRGLEDALSDLSDFREAYREAAKEAYIKQRTTEDPEFSYTPARDDAVLDRSVLAEVGDFAAIEGLLNYYRNRLAPASAESSRYLAQARSLLERAATIDESSATLTGLRIRLNLARVLLAAGDGAALAPLLSRLEEETYEFNAIVERVELLTIQAEWSLSHGGGVAGALAKLDAALAVFREHSYMLPLLLDRLPDIFRSSVELSLKQGQSLKAAQLLEELRSLRLQAEFYRFPLELNGEAGEVQRSIRQSRFRLRALSAEEVRLRMEHRSLSPLLREQEAELGRWRLAEQALTGVMPGLSDFVRTRPVWFSNSIDPQRYLRLVGGRTTLSCIQLFRGRMQLQQMPAADVSDSHALERFFSGCAGDVAAPTVLVADGPSVALGVLPPMLRHLRLQAPVALRTNWLDRSPVFIRQRAEEQTDVALFNVSTADSGGEENVVSVMDVPRLMLFARGEKGPEAAWSARQWLSARRDASVVLVSSPGPIPDGKAVPVSQQRSLMEYWQGLEWVADVFRSAGGGALLSGKDSAEMRPRVEPILAAQEDPRDLILFGYAGFDRARLVDVLREKHLAAFRQGMSLLPGEPSRALRQFQLADSYLRGTADSGRIGAENRMQLGRALVSVDAEKGGEYFDALLGEERADAARRREIYRLWLLGLATGGQWSRVAEVQKKAEAERAIPADLAQMLLILRNLESAHPTERNPIPEELTMRQVFAREPELAERLAALLYRHGELDLASTISRSPAISESRQRVEVERSLFRGLPLPRIDRQGVEGDDMMLLWAAGEGLWEFFDDFLASRSGLYSGSAWEQKALLYRVLRRRWKDGIGGIDEMSCLTAPPEQRAGLFDTRLFRRDRARTGRSGCDALTPTEQALFFRMALDSLPLDTTGQIRTLLRQLILVARQRSSLRGSRMALMVSREYLKMGMPDQASRFFALFTPVKGGHSPSADLVADHASISVWLDLFGRSVPPDQLNLALQNGRASRIYQVLHPTKGALPPGQSTVVQILKAMGDPSFDTRDRLLACSVMLERARSEGDGEGVLDLIFAWKRLMQGRSDWVPADRPARRLRERLPERQSFVAVHDTGSDFISVEIAGGQTVVRKMDRPSSVLRGRLLAYLQSREEGTTISGTAALLSGEYQSLLPEHAIGRQYLWFTGVHESAPMETGENVLHVLDPDALLSGPILKLAGRPGKEFRVAAVELAPASDAEGRILRDAIRRIAAWANVERDRAGGAAGRPIDIREGLAHGIAEDWILLDLVGGSLMPPGAARPKPELPAPGKGRISGVGIVFRAPRSALSFFPFFLKNYLKADMLASGAFERLEYARRVLRDAEAEDHLFLKLSVGSLVE